MAAASAGNIAALFSTLPHLRASREIVYKTLESKVGEFWQEYTTKDVLEILGVFAAMKMRTGEKVLRVLSQWLRVNVQTLSEGETLAVIYCLHNLEYIDDAIIRYGGQISISILLFNADDGQSFSTACCYVVLSFATLNDYVVD